MDTLHGPFPYRAKAVSKASDIAWNNGTRCKVVYVEGWMIIEFKKG